MVKNRAFAANIAAAVQVEQNHFFVRYRKSVHFLGSDGWDCYFFDPHTSGGTVDLTPWRGGWAPRWSAAFLGAQFKNTPTAELLQGNLHCVTIECNSDFVALLVRKK